MTDQPKTKHHSFRLDPDLVNWVAEYAEAIGSNRTKVIEALLKALREGRLWVEPKPNPFPGVQYPEPLPVKPYPRGTVPVGTYPHRTTEQKETVS